MKRFLMNLLLTIANTADNLASKLSTNEPQPLLDHEKRGYEPAGILHYGGAPVYSSFTEPTEMRDQEGYFYRGHIITDNAHAVYRIELKYAGWPNPPAEYVGLFTKEQILNGEHLHAKDQE